MMDRTFVHQQLTARKMLLKRCIVHNVVGISHIGTYECNLASQFNNASSFNVSHVETIFRPTPNFQTF